MAKRRRIPRYLKDDPAWREAEARRRSGIPRDAIAADLSQQAPNNSYSRLLYYMDYEFVCADCGSIQVWTAKQQQWWYEVAKGSIHAGAKRCRPCRAAHRAARQAQAERSRKPDA
jgi:Probable zinc-ribbon domain